MKQRKPKICPICEDWFIPQRPIQKVCSPKCAHQHAKNLIAKKEAKEVDTKIKAYKSDLLGVPELKNRLQVHINKIVRLIDKGHPCISSGASYGTYTVHAGHYHSIGSNETLRFNLLNIFAQSNSDNIYKSGNELQYGFNLELTFGSDLKEEVDGLGLKYPSFKPNKIDMLTYCALAQRIVLRLEKENKIYTTNERIELRRKFNTEIGIYL